ncbi:hypothetical protein FSP39_008618 [Pinctada imbricata]|uniref:Uncharacterized protein n=1 Tax=Pinctada imbricata TaxID=66713 RepID=A0AA89C4R8_PINIB|nr:hypothetical protein FSP39_008618 [Pinctada imbricata]
MKKSLFYRSVPGHPLDGRTLSGSDLEWKAGGWGVASAQRVDPRHEMPSGGGTRTDNIGVVYRRSEINSTAGESEGSSIRLIEPEYSTINVDQDYPGNLVSPIPVESNVPTAPPPSYDSAITRYNDVRTDSTSSNEFEDASSRIFSPDLSSNNHAEEYSVLQTASSVRNAPTDPLLPIYYNFFSHHSASPEPNAPNEHLMPTPYYAHTDYPTDRNVPNAPIEPPIRSYHDDFNTATDRHVLSESLDPPPPPYDIVVRRNAPFRNVNYTTVVIADSPPSYEEAV